MDSFNVCVCIVYVSALYFHESFAVNSSALAGPEFDNREGEELGQHLAGRLTEAYSNTSAIDLSQLSVISGKQCWILYVDALVRPWGEEFTKGF